ncbi:MAG: chromate transporter [Ndongobacter sp.]|nr:chromate transporter [Ndongobacter sp.]
MTPLISLYLTFAKIGAMAFGGGYASLPLIERYVIREHQWITMRGMTDLVSLSQMTPGPVAINTATFIGTKVQGIPGAIIATLGNVTIPLILMLALGRIIFEGTRPACIDRILSGLKPAIVGLIAIAALSMLRSSLFTGGTVGIHTVELLPLLCFGIGLAFYWRRKLNVIQLVGVAAAVGVVWHAAAMLL